MAVCRCRMTPSVRRKCLFLFCFIATVLVLLLQLLGAVYIHGIVKQFKRNVFGFHDFSAWVKDNLTECDGHFTGYGHQFAVLKDAVIVPKYQYFYLPCSDISSLHRYKFDFGKEGTHLNEWLNNIRSYKRENFGMLNREDKFTVLVLRYEYANMYHTMTDWYNVFLLTKLLNVNIADISVVLQDANAPGHLDVVWRTLFDNVLDGRNLTSPTLFKYLAWNIIGYESPINHHGLEVLPYMEDFHTFFIQKHGIERTKRLDCDNISLLFLWRRDYVAHPGNPTGVIKRKIKNEDELLTYLSNKYPRMKVHGSQFDSFTFHEQLNLITNTDILVSMHGAGLSHILFLPQHAGVIELFPTYWPKFGMTHFKSMARWRGVKYRSWQNYNPSTEDDNYYSYISPANLYLYVDQVYKEMCSN